MGVLPARAPGNLADVLRLGASRYGDRAMLTCDGRTFGYREFNERVNRLAGGLAGIGVTRDDVVASIAQNGDDLLALYFALAKLGAVSVPLNTMLMPADVDDVLDRSAARMLVFAPEFAERVDRVAAGVERLSLDRLAELEAAGSAREPVPVEGGDRPSTVIYTSGSTGPPKGCMKTHANQIWSAVNCQLETPRGAGDVEMFTVPLAGVGFSNFVLGSMLGGARVVLCRFDAEACLRTIAAERVTHVFLAGTMLDAMLACDGERRHDLSSLRLVETAYQLSDRLRSSIAARFGPIVRYCYGSSEGSNWAAPADVFLSRPDCVGLPKGVDDFRIVDDAGTLLGPGEVGEVLIGGPTVMLGYLGDPDGTAEVLQDGWLRSGDLGEIADDGMLLFRGRKKDMIKTGGMNVAAAEVELAVARHPSVLEVAVIGVADDHWGEAVRAIVAPVPNVATTTLAEQLHRHCRAELASYKRPKDFVVVEEIPKNPGGKIAKGLVRERWGAAR